MFSTINIFRSSVADDTGARPIPEILKHNLLLKTIAFHDALNGYAFNRKNCIASAFFPIIDFGFCNHQKDRTLLQVAIKTNFLHTIIDPELINYSYQRWIFLHPG